MQHNFDSQLEQLRSLLEEALAKFDARYQQDHFPQTLTKYSKYILCAFIDEAVLNTHDTEELAWRGNSLLSQFFNETWGGRDFL